MAIADWAAELLMERPELRALAFSILVIGEMLMLTAI